MKLASTMITVIMAALVAAVFLGPVATGADLDGDGRVGSSDVAVMKAAFYSSDPAADLNADGRVNFADLAILRAAYDAAVGNSSSSIRHGVELSSISLQPAVLDVDLEQAFVLELWADFSAEPTIGGGMDVHYDPATLAYSSFEFDESLQDDPDFRSFPDASNPGELSSLAFGNFDGIFGLQLVGRYTFQAINLGPSPLTMDDDSDGPAGPFVALDPIVIQSIDFFGATVTVADIPRGSIVVDQLDIAFPDTGVGDQSSVDLLISNIGDADLNIGQIAQNDALAAPFMVQSDTCSLQPLLPAASCTVTLIFSPTALNTLSDTFDIPSDDFFNPSVVISVTGTGVPVPIPAITIAPTIVAFPTIAPGETLSSDLTVTSSGTAPLEIGTVGAAVPLDPPYSIIADTCSGQSLLPAGNCVITVQFAPDDGALFADGFDIPSNDAAKPVVTVPVLGSSSDQIAGLYFGAFGVFGRCDNLTTGQFVSLELSGARELRCEEAGLLTATGEQIRIMYTGVVTRPAFVGGGVHSVEMLQVSCRNVTTGDSAMFPPQSILGWSCNDGGVGFAQSERVQMVLWGIAE